MEDGYVSQWETGTVRQAVSNRHACEKAGPSPTHTPPHAPTHTHRQWNSPSFSVSVGRNFLARQGQAGFCRRLYIGLQEKEGKRAKTGWHFCTCMPTCLAVLKYYLGGCFCRLEGGKEEEAWQPQNICYRLHCGMKKKKRRRAWRLAASLRCSVPASPIRSSSVLASSSIPATQALISI